MNQDSKSRDSIIWILYDGECIFCHNYMTMIRLQENISKIILLDARQPNPLLTEATKQGLNIDKGFVIKVGGEIYYGAHALHILAILGSSSKRFSRCTYFLFNSKKLTLILYPYLKACRDFFLYIKSTSKINNLKHKESI